MSDEQQGFFEKIRSAIEEATTLEIVTVVGPVDLSKTKTTEFTGAAMRTRIDMAGGDISTQLDPAFVTGDYQSLREFQRKREEQGHEIVRNNIETLKALVDFVRTQLEGKDEPKPDGGE